MQLRRLREERQLSQSAVARASGISAPFLSQIEHGERTPSLETFSKICVALGASDDQIAKLIKDAAA